MYFVSVHDDGYNAFALFRHCMNVCDEYMMINFGKEDKLHLKQSEREGLDESWEATYT